MAFALHCAFVMALLCRVEAVQHLAFFGVRFYFGLLRLRQRFINFVPNVSTSRLVGLELVIEHVCSQGLS